MEKNLMTRRGFAILGAGAATAAATLVSSASPAAAYQGNMERALSELYGSLASLREATANKGGHRANAINLIQQAITEVQAGIDYADETGGGGR